jgi:putative effector of murein hydrolase LrgA (UPF0299 family)
MVLLHLVSHFRLSLPVHYVLVNLSILYLCLVFGLIHLDLILQVLNLLLNGVSFIHCPTTLGLYQLKLLHK